MKYVLFFLHHTLWKTTIKKPRKSYTNVRKKPVEAKASERSQFVESNPATFSLMTHDA